MTKATDEATELRKKGACLGVKVAERDRPADVARGVGDVREELGAGDLPRVPLWEV